jgi:hypothetical protein
MKFRSDPATITGSIAPVVSPFRAEGAPVLEGPVAGVAGAGTAGR